jgi:hypothetical protein
MENHSGIVGLGSKNFALTQATSDPARGMGFRPNVSGGVGCEHHEVSTLKTMGVSAIRG